MLPFPQISDSISQNYDIFQLDVMLYYEKLWNVKLLNLVILCKITVMSCSKHIIFVIQCCRGDELDVLMKKITQLKMETTS